MIEGDYTQESWAAALMDELGLTESQRQEARGAYREAPAGVIACAEAALRRSNSEPRALFLTMLRASDHRRAHEQQPDHRPWTGWRFVRGSHSGRYERDPKGRDPLPAGYDGAAPG